MKNVIVIIGLALFALPVLAPAQDNMGRGRVTGQVVDETGAPVADAKVVIQSLQGTARLEGTTNKKGAFAVAGMGTGEWRVVVSKDGFGAASADIHVSQLKTNPPLNVRLKRSSGAPDLRADETGRSLLDRGTALLEAGQYDEALAVFEEFSGKYPEIYAVRLNVATALMKKGELDRAESEFRAVYDKAVQAPAGAAADKEASLRALSGLGELALKRGDFAAAQGFFRKALEISPDDAAAAYNVGEIFFSGRQVDDAIAYFEMAARIRKDWPKAYHRLGLAYLNQGNIDKAVENLKKFVELDPENPETANVKATIAAVEKLKK